MLVWDYRTCFDWAKKQLFNILRGNKSKINFADGHGCRDGSFRAGRVSVGRFPIPNPARCVKAVEFGQIAPDGFEAATVINHIVYEQDQVMGTTWLTLSAILIFSLWQLFSKLSENLSGLTSFRNESVASRNNSLPLSQASDSFLTLFEIVTRFCGSVSYR